MMRPKFEDVVEYVKAGEEDPEMRETLDLHPDGQEFLKQARFICKALQKQLESSGDSKIAGVQSQYYQASEESLVLEFEDVEDFANRIPEKPIDIDPSSIHEMIKHHRFDGNDLGILEFETGEEQVRLSYRPSESVMERFGKPYLIKFAMAQKASEGIQIRGRSFDIALPDTVPSGETVRMRVTAGLTATPLRGTNITYMPESGPFQRLNADKMGFMSFPVPQLLGILRIDAPDPHFLRIEVTNDN